jgi:hypothetical protein
MSDLVTVTLPRDVAREVAQAITYRYDFLAAYGSDNTDPEVVETERLGAALDALAAAGVTP